ncbi:hypothetical protein N7454_006005 [Penicillium verhagenii]|nr:hypothetical protein N7454_006005 [Penicillium verhagenii]
MCSWTPTIVWLGCPVFDRRIPRLLRSRGVLDLCPDVSGILEILLPVRTTAVVRYTVAIILSSGQRKDELVFTDADDDITDDADDANVAGDADTDADADEADGV